VCNDWRIKMPWRDPERWFTIPIIGGMLAIFWRGISIKSEKIDESLTGYVTEKDCGMKQENMTLRLEKTIKTEITMLKDETFEHMQAIEKAVQGLKK